MTPDDLDNLRHKLLTAQQWYNEGNFGGATRIYRDIIARNPEQPDALFRLGAIALQTQNPALALTLFDATVRCVPDFALAHAHRAMALRILDRSDEALAAARQALAIDSHNAEALDLIGCLWRGKERFDLAHQAHQQAIKLQPNNGRFYHNYAITLARAGHYNLSHQRAQKCVSLLPGQLFPLMTLGNILGECGYPRRAITCYQMAQKIDPLHVEAVQSEGRARLALGEMELGWALLERRLLMTPCNERLAVLPRWQGQAVGHLMIVAEQGHGDSLMFARYLSLLRSCAKKISLVVSKPLQRLMQNTFPDIAVYDPDAVWPDIDAYELILSLPHHLGTRIGTIPPLQPYQALDGERNSWKARLASIPYPRIGIAWAGNPGNHMDYRRSIPFAKYYPVIDIAKAHIIALQKGPGELDLTTHEILNAAPYLNDFADTAALLAELDLVITIDTSVAHLAASTGKPVWLMLAFDADWRWMLERIDSPWYPTVRLFRQPEPGDWSAVIDVATARLVKLLAGDRTVLDPPLASTVTADQNSRAVTLT